MNPSGWKAPDPTTVSSAILFHCATVFPGGRVAATVRVAPVGTATATTRAMMTTARRFMPNFLSFGGFHCTAWSLTRGPLRGRCSALRDGVADGGCGEGRERNAGIPRAGTGRDRPQRRGQADRLAHPADTARAAADACERGRLDGPHRRCALARQPTRSPPEALVPRLEAAGNAPAWRGGGCPGRHAGDGSDRLHPSDRS